MSIAVPPVIVEAFAQSGGFNVIPATPNATPGAASLELGFPPLTRTPLTGGGIPPSGLDMNGILRLISQHTVWLQAGGFYVWSAALVAARGGYDEGVILRSAVNPLLFFINLEYDNENDPDDDPTDWLAFTPAGSPTGLQTQTLAAGSTNNLALAPKTGFLDITANAAGSTLTGLDGDSDGQIVTITNVSANLLTLASLTGSSAGNQFRLGTNLGLLQYGRQTFRYSSALAVWVPT